MEPVPAPEIEREAGGFGDSAGAAATSGSRGCHGGWGGPLTVQERERERRRVCV